MLRVPINDVVIDSLRGQPSTAASDRERQLLNRLMWQRRRALRRRHLAVRLRDACEAKRSLVQEGKSSHFKWQRVFGHGSPAVFYADIFDLVDTQERARLVCSLGARSSANWFFLVLI